MKLPIPFLLAFFFSQILSLHADVCNWTGFGDGVNWSDGNNWSCAHMPGTADDVIINSGTPTLDVPATIASMSMSSGTLTGSNNISLSGTLTWSGGTIGGTGTMTVAGATTITNSPALTARTLTLNGGGTWSPPVSTQAFFTNDNANIIVPAGQTLTITTTGNSSFSSTSGAGVFTLHGTLVKNGAGWVHSAKQSFQNDGTVNVNQGEVYVGAFGESSSHASNGATFNLASNTLFATHGGTHGFTNCNINGNGNFGVTGTGAFGIFSGNVLAPGSSPGNLFIQNNNPLNLSTGIFNVELAGYGGPGVPNGHDQVNTSEAVLLGGTLNISFLNGFTPAINDFFIIMNCQGVGCSGDFATINHPGNNPNAWDIDVTTNPNQVRLVLAQALPVELLDFIAIPTGTVALLNWKTASETNNRGFHIERSPDGKDWLVQGFVEGHGTTTEAHEYAYVDETPLPGINYYRLRQVDFDGKTDYSPIEAVTMDGHVASIGEIYPNPATATSVLLDFTAAHDSEWQVQITDLNGRVFWIETRQIVTGINVVTFDMTGLANGVYFVKMENGTERVYRKLVIE